MVPEPWQFYTTQKSPSFSHPLNGYDLHVCLKSLVDSPGKSTKFKLAPLITCEQLGWQLGSQREHPCMKWRPGLHKCDGQTQAAETTVDKFLHFSIQESHKNSIYITWVLSHKILVYSCQQSCMPQDLMPSKVEEALKVSVFLLAGYMMDVRLKLLLYQLWKKKTEEYPGHRFLYFSSNKYITSVSKYHR